MQSNRRRRPINYSRPQEQGMSKFTAFMMLVFFGMIVWVFRINESLKATEKENSELKSEIATKDAQIIAIHRLDSIKPIEPIKIEEIKPIKPKKQKKDTSTAAKNSDTTAHIINPANLEKESADTLN